MILIADAGSTKTSWALINSDSILYYHTNGINPVLHDTVYIHHLLRQVAENLVGSNPVQAVLYFGAGCTPHTSPGLKNILEEAFPLAATCSVQSDMSGAAIAACGYSEGIVCILGTGSNCALYDGHEITYPVASGGYILGDEGSGNYIGKKLLIDYLRNRLPESLKKEIESGGVTPATIIEHVYRKPAAGTYLASFCKLAGDNIHLEYCKNLVKKSMDDFFTHTVSTIPGYHHYPLHFSGSVAYHFRDLLELSAAEKSLRIDSVMQQPIEKLAAFIQNSYFHSV